MSENAEIKIKNLSLFCFRNYLQSDIVRLIFSKKDYIFIPNHINDPNDEDSEPYTKHMYRTTVSNAKQRLDVLGFSLSRLEALFERNINDAIYYDSFLSHLHVNDDDYEKKAKERIKKYVTFKKWKNSMNKITKYQLEDGTITPYDRSTANSIEINTECDKIIYYALKDYDSNSFYGLNIEVISIGYIFRLILESCEPTDEIILDFSNLGYWADDCIPKAISATEIDEKIIVLVEGTSDKDILEFALDKLYPHLSDLFYFMDFGDEYGGKRDGGTSFLIKNLKTFYFSKIKSKFIAIFDNDAEGYQSKCTLENEIKNWPDNFRILLYPQDKLFKSYPTILPNGTICNDDINKKACSIELYLPDSIIQDNGKYYPIEWEARKKIVIGSANSEYLYQGVISQKDDIKNKFHDLRKAIENGNRLFVKEEWVRIKQILDSIVFAFKK
ncbi:MAG: hypothetical protein K2K66_07910 [Ruminococcus sp.]|nr:hypothetical protein [Ruminococcus sp.]